MCISYVYYLVKDVVKLFFFYFYRSMVNKDYHYHYCYTTPVFVVSPKL